MKLKINITLIALLFITSFAHATGVYFDNVSGTDDSGTCLQVAPCKTFPGAVTNGRFTELSSNDYFFNKGDVWVGADALIEPAVGGVFNNVMNFTSYGAGANPVMRGSITATEHGGSWSQDGSNPWYELTGVNWGDDDADSTKGLLVYNTTTDRVYEVARSKTGTIPNGDKVTIPGMIPGSFFLDDSADILYVYAYDSTVGTPVAPVDGETFITKYTTRSDHGLIDLDEGIRYVTVDGIDIIGSLYEGISFRDIHGTYANATSSFNGRPGAYWHAAGTDQHADFGLLDNANIHRNVRRRSQGVTIETRYTWITDSAVTNNYWAGVDFLDYNRGGASNSTKCEYSGIIGSVVDNNGAHPNTNDSNFLLDGANHIVIYNNVFAYAGQEAQITADANPSYYQGSGTERRNNITISDEVNSAANHGVDYVYIINNLSYDAQDNLIKVSNFGGTLKDNIFVLGNTLFGWNPAFYGSNLSGIEPTGSMYWYNNLSAQNTGGHFFNYLQNDIANIMNADNNAYESGDANFVRLADGTEYDLSGWQSALNNTDVDSNSMSSNSDIYLNSRASGSGSYPDYYLNQSTSPLVDAGDWQHMIDLIPTAILPTQYGTTNTDLTEDDVSTPADFDMGYHYNIDETDNALFLAWELPAGEPTGLSATTITGSRIDLAWTAPATLNNDTITGYKINRQDDGGAWATIVADNGVTVTYSNTGLSSNVTYNYRVYTLSTDDTSSLAQTSAPSVADSSVTSAGSPSQVTGLSATASGSTIINLSWSTPDAGGSAITGYFIEMETPVGNGFGTEVDDTGNTNTTYSDTGLTASTQYNYRVSAINAIGTGTASSAANDTTAGVGEIPCSSDCSMTITNVTFSNVTL